MERWAFESFQARESLSLGMTQITKAYDVHAADTLIMQT